MPEKKSCFIIMPLTMPESLSLHYDNDREHFYHVLDHLFLPAIEQAGMIPTKPIAKGADNIPAEIIKNLEISDLVLCDMSILNPNVFFEFGIRTALNKSVCVVKDDYTEKIPFDTSTINYHTYKRGLRPWEIKNETSKLAEHILESDSRSDGKNSLWKYYSLTSVATPATIDDPLTEKLNLIISKLEKSQSNIENISVGNLTPSQYLNPKPDIQKSVNNFLTSFLKERNIDEWDLSFSKTRSGQIAELKIPYRLFRDDKFKSKFDNEIRQVLRNLFGIDLIISSIDLI